jgi:hypothetical protein
MNAANPTRLPANPAGSAPSGPDTITRSRPARIGVSPASKGADTTAALWYLGLVAARDGRRDAARDYWRRLQAGMDPRDPDADLVKQALEALGR